MGRDTMCVCKYYIKPSNFVLASSNQSQTNYALIISPVLVKTLEYCLDSNDFHTFKFSERYSAFNYEIKKYMISFK